MNNVITVTLDKVYGNEVIRPKCEKALAFARLLGQKSLTRANIRDIKSLGFVVMADVHGVQVNNLFDKE